ncbi:hypothetical protein X777_00202 [Ooceraea biroi]|uniref:Uncharacterized protein n=1 Tax=Ooceraea biroi TaxID=2015173 RepID=A0A026VRP2_OOCBI|nr:hypothetical protein X777_00202 [Ooceraea biroi]
MIFKSCAWPNEMKDENAIGASAANEATERKIADAVLRCCPCVFRCRKSVGVDHDKDEDDNVSISTIITTATTPVIALRLNRNSDTVYVVH